MDVFVFDSSALLRHTDNEPGASRVDEIFEAFLRGNAEIVVSAVQWGEVAGVQRKRFGSAEQERTLQRLGLLGLRIVSATGERAVHAAEIRADRKIAYADAFAIDLAMDSTDHILVTADFGFKAVEDLARIEFLPLK
jgi:predicted nucleic acid-binding protein